MTSPLTDVSYLTSVLAQHGIHPQRQASQNFLICPPVIEKTLLAAQAGSQLVTELGAGAGVLTQALLAARFVVRAIERDPDLAQVAQSLVPPELSPSLSMVVDDIRRAPWSHEQPYQIIGNIPYHLSGLIIRKVTTVFPAPDNVILLVQKEVGERLAAGPPHLSLIGLAVQLWGEATVLLRVPATCFWPAPLVTSCLVQLRPRSEGQTTPLDEREAVLKVAKHFFSTRRKQMGGVLRRWRGLDEPAATQILQQSGIDPAARPQEVSVSQWISLTQALSR